MLARLIRIATALLVPSRRSTVQLTYQSFTDSVLQSNQALAFSPSCCGVRSQTMCHALPTVPAAAWVRMSSGVATAKRMMSLPDTALQDPVAAAPGGAGGTELGQ